ncbi:MAG: hypothetical protein ACKOAG_01770 [Candidatus Kapaibacterium sp.]
MRLLATSASITASIIVSVVMSVVMSITMTASSLHAACIRHVASADTAVALPAASRDALLLSVRLGPETALSATDFFRTLETYAGMTTAALSAPVTYHAALKLRRREWSFGLDAGHCSAYSRFSSTVDVVARSNPQVVVGRRALDQVVTVESTPLAFCVEYCPSVTQFREYLTAGVGATRTRTRWMEDVASTVPADALRSGVRLDSSHIVPLARLGVGVELCFDNHADRTAGSLLVELSYTFAPNTHRPFTALPSSDTRFDAVRGNSMAMCMSSLRLLIGVQISSMRTH